MLGKSKSHNKNWLIVRVVRRITKTIQDSVEVSCNCLMKVVVHRINSVIIRLTALGIVG